MSTRQRDIPALYHPEPIEPGTIVPLPDEETRHVRALRLRPGDPVLLLDGRGTRAEGAMERIDNRGATVRITASVLDEVEAGPYIVLAIGVLADRSRFEWLVEKAVELGVGEIVPMNTRRSEGHIHHERAERIAVSALKQSRRSRLPLLHKARPFQEALAALRVDRGYICHESAPATEALAGRLAAGHGSGIALLIGPEGGFTDEEIAAARSASISVVSLGAVRLRAETAALAALVLATQCASRGDA